MHTNRPSRRRRRTGVALLMGLVASMLAVVANPSVASAEGPAISGAPCAPGVGVTVVVDYQQFGDGIEIGCAPGQQADGFTALTNAGFTFNEDGGPVAGTICQISSKPAEGYPSCWFSGFWGYWKSNGSEAWQWSQVGASDGPLAIDRVEGWSWTSPIPEDYSGVPMRIEVDDLADLLADPAECDAIPQLPTFDIVDDDEVLPVTLADGHPVEVAVLTDLAADPSTATYTERTTLPLTGLSGKVRVVAKRVGDECPDAEVFNSVYDVRGAYAPRWNLTGVPGHPSPAVATASIPAGNWATGHANYVPGANVNASFQTPNGALGSAASGLVVLGDRGRIDLTFAAPITDGEGYDFAVWENGFAVGAAANEIDFLEVGYVEVSSNGTDFVRFDTGSRQLTPVGGFQGQRADLLGGMAGKDLSGRGTPFDLELLRNKPEVRFGSVDLDRVTHVRIVDITGDGLDLDSFGRPIYDAHPTTGSAGFDLTGVAAINVLDEVAPVVEITSAPSGTVETADATIEFTVDDATATNEYRLDGGSWVPATSPISLPELANGAHTVEVRATDAAGNVGSDSASWTVAVPEPQPTSVVGDFDGDGTTDVAVFRPSNGRWYVNGALFASFGIPGDIPVPADYDGDGTTDVAVYRPSNGRWYVQGEPHVAAGIVGDIPVPADYDGDGTADIAVFRPSNARWYIDGVMSSFGIAGDIPVPGDYDGDGSAEIAVYRPSNGRWYVEGNAHVAAGIVGDIPVPADYDGDGTADIAVFRPSNARWYIDGVMSSFGIAGDIPVPGDYDGDGSAGRAIYRPSSGRWYVEGQTFQAVGIAGDVPLVLPAAIRLAMETAAA